MACEELRKELRADQTHTAGHWETALNISYLRVCLLYTRLTTSPSSLSLSLSLSPLSSQLSISPPSSLSSISPLLSLLSLSLLHHPSLLHYEGTGLLFLLCILTHPHRDISISQHFKPVDLQLMSFSLLSLCSYSFWRTCHTNSLKFSTSSNLLTSTINWTPSSSTLRALPRPCPSSSRTHARASSTYWTTGLLLILTTTIVHRPLLFSLSPPVPLRPH